MPTPMMSTKIIPSPAARHQLADLMTRSTPQLLAKHPNQQPALERLMGLQPRIHSDHSTVSQPYTMLQSNPTATLKYADILVEPSNTAHPTCPQSKTFLTTSMFNIPRLQSLIARLESLAAQTEDAHILTPKQQKECNRIARRMNQIEQDHTPDQITQDKTTQDHTAQSNHVSTPIDLKHTVTPRSLLARATDLLKQKTEQLDQANNTIIAPEPLTTQDELEVFLLGSYRNNLRDAFDISKHTLANGKPLEHIYFIGRTWAGAGDVDGNKNDAPAQLVEFADIKAKLCAKMFMDELKLQLDTDSIPQLDTPLRKLDALSGDALFKAVETLESVIKTYLTSAASQAKDPQAAKIMLNVLHNFPLKGPKTDLRQTSFKNDEQTMQCIKALANTSAHQASGKILNIASKAALLEAFTPKDAYTAHQITIREQFLEALHNDHNALKFLATQFKKGSNDWKELDRMHTALTLQDTKDDATKPIRYRISDTRSYCEPLTLRIFEKIAQLKDSIEEPKQRIQTIMLTETQADIEALSLNYTKALNQGYLRGDEPLFLGFSDIQKRMGKTAGTLAIWSNLAKAKAAFDAHQHNPEAHNKSDKPFRVSFGGGVDTNRFGDGLDATKQGMAGSKTSIAHMMQSFATPNADEQIIETHKLYVDSCNQALEGGIIGTLERLGTQSINRFRAYVGQGEIADSATHAAPTDKQSVDVLHLKNAKLPAPRKTNHVDNMGDITAELYRDIAKLTGKSNKSSRAAAKAQTADNRSQAKKDLDTARDKHRASDLNTGRAIGEALKSTTFGAGFQVFAGMNSHQELTEVLPQHRQDIRENHVMRANALAALWVAMTTDYDRATHLANIKSDALSPQEALDRTTRSNQEVLQQFYSTDRQGSPIESAMCEAKTEHFIKLQKHSIEAVRGALWIIANDEAVKTFDQDIKDGKSLAEATQTTVLTLDKHSEYARTHEYTALQDAAHLALAWHDKYNAGTGAEGYNSRLSALLMEHSIDTIKNDKALLDEFLVLTQITRELAPSLQAYLSQRPIAKAQAQPLDAQWSLRSDALNSYIQHAAA